MVGRGGTHDLKRNLHPRERVLVAPKAVASQA
ncbi:mCG148356 [Mus musculus]|nr:mCG148356 [Mus musculus]